MVKLMAFSKRDTVYGICLSVLVQQFLFPVNVEAKKTATRSGLVAATQVGGSTSSSQGGSETDQYGAYGNGSSGSKVNLTALERLKRDIFIGYDKAVPPILDHRHRVDVQVDMTYRQVLDLDEKNQILKSLIWYRQYWSDAHLKWNPAEYDGITKISAPAGNVWRPDITVYEEVGSRDLSPRLPFVELRFSGQILYAEPTILETSCSVNTAFFPFDSQKCEITFVSWTQSVKYIDLTAQRTTDILTEESLNYFIDSGEWVLRKFGVTKQIASYNTIQHNDETETSTLSDLPVETTTILNDISTPSGTYTVGTQDEVGSMTALNNVSTTSDNNTVTTQDEVAATTTTTTTTVSNKLLTPSGTHTVNKQNAASEPADAQDDEEKSYIIVPATSGTTEALVGRKLTPQMYAEVKFSLVIQRNSSLYMQSMLFPSILLTTVALLGFFLPPDSGERVGLQITILLTFMVFLLTVGEMFPASTGPYIGIYFVLSMAQLGINILFTIIVLHIHFKPCVRDKSTWKADRPQWYSIGGIVYEGDSMIPVRTRRVLQFFAKYFNVADPGAVWTWPISNPELMEEGSSASHKSSISVECHGSDSIIEEKTGFTSDEQSPMTPTPPPLIEVNGERKDDENNIKSPSDDKLDPKVAIVASKFLMRRKSPARKQSVPGKEEGRKSTAHKTAKDTQTIINGFRLQVKDLVQDMRSRSKEKDEDEEFEESLEKEQEEWKSVARTVDKLFFRLYVFLMILSYVGLAIVAIHATFQHDLEV